MCISDGTLRAKLDSELTQSESFAVDQHLAACADCRRRAELMAAQAGRVHTLFSALAPLPDEPPIEVQPAFARFQARSASFEGGKTSMFDRLFARRGPLWGAIAAVVLVVVFASSAPMRAWAEKLLGLFRVQRIEVVQFDSRNFKFAGKFSGFFADDFVVTKEPTEPQFVDTADEASTLAGFQVRLPSNRSDRWEMQVSDDVAFHFTINRSRLQTILDEVGRSDLQLPDSIDGATVSVEIPKAVVTEYGDGYRRPRRKSGGQVEWVEHMTFTQIPTPTIITPPDLDIAELAALLMQLLGMSEENARSISQRIDWTSTLVLPIPTDIISYQTVQVDGVEGTLVTSGKEKRPGYMLLWIKDGIIYHLMGTGDASQALSWANALE